ncbi:MAG: sulfite exporter TauE/SafE family protein [Burkholderiaceae bacterium]
MDIGHLSGGLVLLGSLAFFLAGTVKGVLGLGLPTVSIGLLGLMISPTQAASLIILPALATNIWQFCGGDARAEILRRLLTMMLAMVVGVWFGVKLMLGAHQALVGMALGLLLIVYAVFGLRASLPKTGTEAETFLSPLAGVVTGGLAGATGIMVMPGLAYLQSLGFERRQLIQALGLMFTVGSVSLGGLLWIYSEHWVSLNSEAWIGVSVTGTVAAMLGMRLGRRIEPKLSGPLFRRLFSVWLVINGLVIITRNQTLF